MIHEDSVIAYLKWTRENYKLAAEFSFVHETGQHSELLGYARWYDKVYLPYLESLP